LVRKGPSAVKSRNGKKDLKVELRSEPRFFSYELLTEKAPSVVGSIPSYLSQASTG